ncbi:hypothetical protein [Wenxinia saemankumensis]|uniref:Uncharacterized protein n=1 Tax=Wenxinia saemankumensis TaxID=1447782 RepID=A0A1M6G8B1_9RHOB|nr:hypothetical protein [Wenxinia saemankumensis]SHJ06152.1 hypothetical protein SAMN05444417_2740 [Wenxinia saemankumensis]
MPGSRPLRLASVLLLAAALAHLAAPAFGGATGTNLILGAVLVVLAFALGAGLRAAGWLALPVALIDAAATATARDIPLWLAWGEAALAILAALALFVALWKARPRPA